MKDAKDVRLVWVDLETTGLDAEKNEIVEIAVGISPLTNPTDFHLQYERTYRAHWDGDGDLYPTVHPIVMEMHTKSGLIERSKAAPTLFGSEAALLFQSYLPKDVELILAGCTVHFDRRFLQANGVPIEKLFSHKLFDTSAMKLLCLSLGAPRDYDATFSVTGDKVESAHLAADDVRFSVARYVRSVNWLKSYFRRGV
jgi:oligoribonuclease